MVWFIVPSKSELKRTVNRTKTMKNFDSFYRRLVCKVNMDIRKYPYEKIAELLTAKNNMLATLDGSEQFACLIERSSSCWLTRDLGGKWNDGWNSASMVSTRRWCLGLISSVSDVVLLRSIYREWTTWEVGPLDLASGPHITLILGDGLSLRYCYIAKYL